MRSTVERGSLLPLFSASLLAVSSIGAPKQSGLGVRKAFGVECRGASVPLSASRLAGESGSRLPQANAFGWWAHSLDWWTQSLNG